MAMESLLQPLTLSLLRENSLVGTFCTANLVRRQSTGTSSEALPCGKSEVSSFFTDDEENDGQNARRISLAKAVLAEAANSYTPAAVLLTKSACRNTGALGPLVGMLRDCSDTDKLRVALETLAFLCLDKSNRKIALELTTLDELLNIMRRSTDQNLLLRALEATTNMCKYDWKDKMVLWSHPNKGALLSLISTRHSSAVIIESLRTCRQLCFSGSSMLLEPALLTMASELLHPHMEHPVLLKALKLLTSAADVPNTEQLHASGWHNAVFRIVPLLTQCNNADVLNSALNVLVNLSDHAHFRNMFYASGCIMPLLNLLNDNNCTLGKSASCVLSALAEGGLSRDKLCQDTALLAMLRVLKANKCVVVSIGVLYMLGRLASHRVQVAQRLKTWGAVPLLLKLVQSCSDGDAVLGALQLLELLGESPASNGSAGTSPPLSVLSSMDGDTSSSCAGSGAVTPASAASAHGMLAMQSGAYALSSAAAMQACPSVPSLDVTNSFKILATASTAH